MKRVVARQVGGDQREQARVVEERDVLDRSPSTRPWTQVGSESSWADGSRASPRVASNATSRPATTSSIKTNSEWTDPRIRAIATAWDRSFRSLRARRYASACMLSSPWTRMIGMWPMTPSTVARDTLGPAWAPGSGPRPATLRPGRDPRTGGTRTTALLHCTTRNSRVPERRTHPGDHRPGRDRRAGVEELERGQDPREQPGHEADQLVDVLPRRRLDQHRAEVAQEEDRDADDQVDQHRQPGRDRHADARQHGHLEEPQRQARQHLPDLVPPLGRLGDARRPTRAGRTPYLYQTPIANSGPQQRRTAPARPARSPGTCPR